MNLLEIFTIGHSTHSWERFAELLKAAQVTAVADVRTSPYSRHCPHFNRDELRKALSGAGLSYVYLGRELGGRPSGGQFYSGGIVDYEKVAKSVEFNKGLDRVIEGAQRYRISLMCSEQEPLDCHRCLLIGRILVERGINVRHILSSGEVVDHDAIEEKLLQLSGRSDDDFFASPAERRSLAYRDRTRTVAFAEHESDANDRTMTE